MIECPHKTKTMGRVILMTVVWSSFVTGCSGYRLVRTVDSMPMKPAVASTKNIQPQKVDHQSTLSAIEDFLERTSDFPPRAGTVLYSHLWRSAIDQPFSAPRDALAMRGGGMRAFRDT